MSYQTDPMLIIDLIRLKEKLNWKTFVETGTDTGHSIKILQWYFEEIYSCEIDKDKINILMQDGFFKNKYENRSAYNLSAKIQKVKIYDESSQTALNKIFEEIGHDEFFLYLDAHIDNDPNVESIPILEELNIISTYKLKPIIIIHDFKHTDLQFRPGYKFNNKTQELSYEYVKDSMDKIYGIDEWDWKLNEESYNLTGDKIGAGYFWKKGLIC
jgi:hypothetical protein